jgi:hypothetical protein
MTAQALGYVVCSRYFLPLGSVVWLDRVGLFDVYGYYEGVNFIVEVRSSFSLN